MKIKRLRINGLFNDIFLASRELKITYSLEMENNEDKLDSVQILFNNKKYEPIDNQLLINDSSLKPFSSYLLKLEIFSPSGKDTKEVMVHTGHYESELKGKWITHPNYVFKEKRISPKVLNFKKELNLTKKVKSAIIYSSALGIYNLYLDNERVNKTERLLPGFTSYKHQIQYQRFDVTNEIKNDSIISMDVAGGWAVGGYVYTRVNRVTCDKQAMFLELHILYEDNSEEIIISDESWLTAINNKYSVACIYDGEIYNPNEEIKDYVQAGIAKFNFKPHLVPHYGTYNRVIQELDAEIIKEDEEKIIYDFHQNFAGVINIKVNAHKGDKIIIHHAEILRNDGGLNTSFLRSAKQEIIYTCKEGENNYNPTFTYMGFRYIEVIGVKKENITVKGLVVSADIPQTGYFKTNHALLNRLQENILWSSRSNFVEIPTDCPQRDERMGWTGDIAVFAPTALDNFDAEAFLRKWLVDLRSEQLKTGGLPNTIPAQGLTFPTTMPRMAIDFWGDASLLVPQAIYEHYGNIDILEESYDSMKRYVDASKFWAGLLSFGKSRYIWNTPAVFHFGDWVAPDVPQMGQWQARAIYTATCSLANTSKLLSNAANILNKEEDYKKYQTMSQKVGEAFEWRLTDGKGKSKKEFQTAYVLPIQFDMYKDEETKKTAVTNLVNLIKKNSYCIGTGFPGTPYILYALFDNGAEDTAMKMLLNEKCPSWLYEAKVGGTTIWERWDGLDEEGKCPIKEDGTGGMISYNHYASGAVGDFFYKRLAGITPLEYGYKYFQIKPYINEKYLSKVAAKIESIYGDIKVSYEINDHKSIVKVDVPYGSKAKIVLDKEYEVEAGHHEFCY